jgi:hypothetical protein
MAKKKKKSKKKAQTMQTSSKEIRSVANAYSKLWYNKPLGKI